MPLKKISFRTTQQDQNQRLDQVLAVRIPALIGTPLSKAKVRKLIVAGAVYLNRSRIRIASKNLMPNANIEVYIDLERLDVKEGGREPFLFTEDRILFEDSYLIAVNKPPGLPTQPTLDEARDNLFHSVKKFMAKRDGVVDPYLGLHHRLDRDTSGVLVFTKAVEANKGMAENFSAHRATKTYHALTSYISSRMTPKKWTVKNYLGRLKGTGKKSRFGSVRSGGDLAETDFSLIEEFKRGLWLEATPRTGRTHQIRVHLSEAGLPILGDLTYGGQNEICGIKIPRLMLHALSLTFPHPIHNNRIAVQCGLPGDFNQCLEALKRGQTGS